MRSAAEGTVSGKRRRLEIGPDGEALGNFPEVFIHLALISCPFNLDRALG